MENGLKLIVVQIKWRNISFLLLLKSINSTSKLRNGDSGAHKFVRQRKFSLLNIDVSWMFQSCPVEAMFEIVEIIFIFDEANPIGPVHDGIGMKTKAVRYFDKVDLAVYEPDSFDE